MLRSIRHKLLAGFLALGVLPVALVSMYANQTNNGALIHSAGDTLQAHADALIDKVDRNLFERYGDVQAFAFHPNARGTPQEIAEAADFYTKSYVIYDLMLVTDLDGKVVSANTVSFDGKPIETKSLIGQSVADQAWFQKIRSGSVKAGETVFDEPVHDPMVRSVYGDERVTLAYSAPIFDANGKIVRIWSNRVSWDRVVGQIMDEFLTAENVDGQAHITAHVIAKDKTILSGPVGSASRMETAAANAGSAGKTGFVEETDDESGTELVSGYSASNGALGFAGYGWTVVLSQNRSDVLQAGGGLARILLIASAITTLIVTLVGLAMAARITKPITSVANALSQVAEGDFTQHVEITSNDELGHMAESLNKAIEGMRVALSEVQGSASQFVRVSTELSQSSARMSDGSQQQASALEETAASLEEITGTIKQNADSARQASQLAQSSREIAERGGRVVSQAVDSIKEINRSSEKIANIITTIDEIAFQTNLLALNAAVEAARAGEQGRGFAVVASEVRNLAQRSASSAKEIKALIEESLQKVSAGSELVDKSGQSLQEIVASVKRVTEIIAEIAAASQEQATGVDQVNRAVTQMDQVVQGNAGQSAQLASNATTLAGQSRQLQTMVGRFRVGNVAAQQPMFESAPAPAPSFAAPAPVLPHMQQRRPSAMRSHAAPPPEPVAAAANDQDGFIEF